MHDMHRAYARLVSRLQAFRVAATVTGRHDMAPVIELAQQLVDLLDHIIGELDALKRQCNG